jgi:integrase
MASLTTRNNGSRFISFIDGCGRPQTITLGKVARRYAESVKVKVEDLSSAVANHHAPRDDTTRWLAGIDDRLHEKLARVDLTLPRVKATLQGWLEQYLEEREGELKPESLRKLKQTKTKLLAFFEDDRELRKLTLQDATDWRLFLKSLKLSEAAVKTHCGNAKTMLAEAVRRKLIEDSPFALLKAGPTPSKYSRYVTSEEIDRIIDNCPNTEWRLLFGLARYAGLRIPSESHLLTWADVDFDHARLTVHSPKTEHHEGHAQRMVPITPKLMKLLQDRFAEAAEGQQHLVAISGKGAVIRQARALWKRAGVEPWKRLWQTLRQSCEKQWAMTFPQYAVSKWIGHSITISGRHYANDVPDELFAKAAGPSNAGGDNLTGAQRHAQQKVHEAAGSGPKQKRAAGEADSPKSGACGNFPDISVNPYQAMRWSRGESNPRPVTVSKRPLHV